MSSVALALLVSALTTGISAPDTETSGGTLLTLAFEKPALGAQACANLTDVIEFELKTETTVLPGSDLHIWWAASSTSSCESPTEQLLNLDLQVSDSLIIEGKKLGTHLLPATFSHLTAFAELHRITATTNSALESTPPVMALFRPHSNPTPLRY